VDIETERELIRKCRAGSAAAFEPLVREHQAAALALAEALLADADDAEDAVQEAFVRAYRSLGGMQEDRPFRPWFRTILRNHCMDVLRSPRGRRLGGSLEQIDERMWTEPEGSRRLESAELSSVVRAALLELSPEHREILVLKEIEELSYAAIAQAMSIPQGTVGSRLHHARAALRTVLAARNVSLVEAR
jgi:RNA polymerase sigma-70 factor, ECF subfamily